MKVLRRYRHVLTVVSVFLLVAGVSVAGAIAAEISKAYKTSQDIPDSSLVSLDPSKSGYVQLANTANGSQLFGVAVKSEDSLLAVDSQGGKVQVATTGSATVLASTLNGPIKVGDLISVSPFDGIGMKSTPGANVIGLALTELNSSTDGVVRKQVTDKSGKTSSIDVGMVRITIGVGSDTSAGNGEELTGLQRFAKSLTGKVISPARIVISIVVAVIAITVLITLIYGAIYGSIISIGRNPLAKNAIFRSLSSVVLMAVITAVLAGAIIFFLLR
ncbi:MAG: hypothetical protein U0524_03650 [Candidatus Saccharimonadales bacterium]